MKYRLIIIFSLLTGIGLSACHDEEMPEPYVNTLQVDVTDGSTTLERYARYYSLVLQTPGSEGRIQLVCNEDWLTFSPDTLAADGILVLRAEENTDTKDRTATLSLSDMQGRTAQLDITQLGTGSSAYNDERQYVGMGYNAFQKYNSPESQKMPIVDINRIQQLYPTAYQETQRSMQDYETFSAYSLQEMAYKLTQKSTKELGRGGSLKTVERVRKIDNFSQDESYYGYTRINRRLRSYALDPGVMVYLTEDNAADMLTDDFYKNIYRPIVEGSKNLRDVCNTLITNYGTHLVMSGTVGGSIDLLFAMHYESTHNLQSDVETVSGRWRGTSSTSSETVTGLKIATNGNSVEILGGSDDAKKRLQAAIDSKGDRAKPLDKGLLEAWLESLNTAGELMDYTLMPIYRIFPPDVQNRMLSVLYDLYAVHSDCNLGADILGTDNYGLRADYIKESQFSPNGTQVKIICNNGRPIIECCHEYVPNIRSDKRVQVYYPIRNGYTLHGEGIFPGDGEGNRPARLTFSDSLVYVNPLEDYGPHDRLDSLYYLHGHLYETRYGVPLNKNLKASTRDYRLTLKEYDAEMESFNVVKIGTGYWCRNNVTQDILFYQAEFRDDYEPNRYFACIFDEQDDAFLYWNEETYGPDVEKSTGKATLWYVPTTDDAMNLRAYVGRNLRSLFKGQVSGFDAEFTGYYGNMDYLTGRFYGYYDLRDEDERCYITFLEPDRESARALVLLPDYEVKTSRLIDTYDNYFPIRLFRSNRYKYPDKM